MKRLWIALPVFAAALVLLVVAGCGSGSRPSGPLDDIARAKPAPAPTTFTTVSMVAFQDAWPSATPRWMDIGDFTYSDTFISGFSSSSSGTVSVQYNPTAKNGVLDVRVQALGLKPNFCYQVKLLGKPGNNTAGAGLWGSTGTADMTGNTNILLSGRYWDYSTETPYFNTTNRSQVVASPYYQGGWVAGYMVLGCFVTDASGNTPGWVKLYGDDGVIASHGSYHVVWKSGQSIPFGSAGPYANNITRSGTAYPADPTPATAAVSLYLEREPGTKQPYRLPRGNYDVVLMLTEESFHSAQGSSGGYWNTVRVTDWSPVTSPKSGAPWISGRGTAVKFKVQ